MTKPRNALFLLLGAAQLFFVAASVGVHRTRSQGLIASDGKAYYAWLRSVALDRDLDFSNDFALIYAPGTEPVAPIRPDGLVANKTSVGVAFTEVPGFMLGHVAAFMLGMPRDGISAPYQFAVTIWLQVVCLGALGLLWLGMIRLGADEWIAAIGVASALAATNLLQYVARPAMAHGPGLAVVCVAFYLVVSRERPARWRVAVVGALLGLAVIIRTSNLLLIPFFIPLIRPHLGRSIMNWASFLGGATAMLALQVSFASAQWGQLTYSSYGNEGFTAGVRGIVGTLFSARHGLFVYHPWYLAMLVLAVLAALRRETRSLGVGAIVYFAGFVVANGTWWSWWFGDGFGNRSFVETIPALLVPAILWLTAVAHERRARVLRAIGATSLLLAVANVVLWTGYILRRFPPDGSHTIGEAWLWWL
jgi:hypothetical protein